MDKESLFLSTVTDIKEKIEKGDSYSITRAAGLLRHLFLDGEPLLHAVNRKHKIKIEFETMDFTLKIPIRPYLHWQDLDPTGKNEGARRIKIGLKEFLAAEILVYQDYDFTVKDVLKAAAHIKGGIHSGVAKDEADVALLKFDEVLSVGGLDASTAALKSILAVAVNGLRPLVNAVNAG
jgi:hypothetical protein